jgi:DNA-binding MarR family transcriptional regulator
MTTTTPKVSIDIEDFKRSHRALIHLLQTVDNAPGGTMWTRELLQAMNNWGAHGHNMIKSAEEQGYIKRKQGESEHGHFPKVYNIITPRGRNLLRQLS